MPLIRSYRNVLARLAKMPDQYVSANSLPNGHGHVHPRGASGKTLTDMRKQGLIEYGKNASHSLYGWRITEAGKLALDS